MIKLKLLPLVSIFICLSALINAYPVNNLQTEISIDQDGQSTVKTIIVFDSSAVVGYISLPVYDPILVKVMNGRTELKYTSLGNSILILPAEKRKDYEIQVEYITSALTSKEKDKWKIDYKISSSELIAYDGLEKMGLVITLPDNSVLESITSDPILFTENNKMKAGWKLNIYKNKDIEVNAVYSTDSSVNKHKEKIRNIIVTVILAILALAVSCMIGYYFIDKYLKRVSRGKKDIIKTLTEAEAKVIGLLLENKQQLYQSKIHKETGMSKATLSRVIKRLQNRNIVEVTAMGNTNMVSLTKWFIKK